MLPLHKETLKLRSQAIQAIRSFFFDDGYLEVETPYRIPAPAPEANIDAEASGSWFLHTSPELCMKRLLAAGCSRIFQICRCFRKNERGRKHLPEFTILEWYCAGYNYINLMDQCEELIRYVANSIGVQATLVYQGEDIDLSGSWPRMTVSEAFDQYASISMIEALERDRFDEVIVSEIEPNLGRDKPVFLYDYPASGSALARLKPGNQDLAERFELYICGLEMCNGFSELTDPVEQRIRFEREQEKRRQAGKVIYPVPEKFLEELAHMPGAGGNAFGIDRLMMLFADTTIIDGVVAFTPENL